MISECEQLVIALIIVEVKVLVIIFNYVLISSITPVKIHIMFTYLNNKMDLINFLHYIEDIEE